jgi:hypothetical protein
VITPASGMQSQTGCGRPRAARRRRRRRSRRSGVADADLPCEAHQDVEAERRDPRKPILISSDSSHRPRSQRATGRAGPMRDPERDPAVPRREDRRVGAVGGAVVAGRVEGGGGHVLRRARCSWCRTAHRA